MPGEQRRLKIDYFLCRRRRQRPTAGGEPHGQPNASIQIRQCELRPRDGDGGGLRGVPCRPLRTRTVTSGRQPSRRVFAAAVDGRGRLTGADGAVCRRRARRLPVGGDLPAPAAVRRHAVRRCRLPGAGFRRRSGRTHPADARGHRRPRLPAHVRGRSLPRFGWLDAAAPEVAQRRSQRVASSGADGRLAGHRPPGRRRRHRHVPRGGDRHAERRFRDDALGRGRGCAARGGWRGTRAPSRVRSGSERTGRPVLGVQRRAHGGHDDGDPSLGRRRLGDHRRPSARDALRAGRSVRRPVVRWRAGDPRIPPWQVGGARDRCGARERGRQVAA